MPGSLDGSCITCTGETLAEQVRRLDPPGPDHEVIHSIARPFKKTGGLRLLRGNFAPEGGAILKVAGVEGGIKDGVFTGRARVFNSERELITALEKTPDVFADHDMVVIRYEGPRGAPGMPELLDPTSRITALCRQKNITIALMTDARFSGGSVGLVIGHVAPEAYLGGPIALIENGDTIVVDLNEDRLDCRELADDALRAQRAAAWQAARGRTRRRAPGREAGDEPSAQENAVRSAPGAARRGDGDWIGRAERVVDHNTLSGPFPRGGLVFPRAWRSAPVHVAFEVRSPWERGRGG